MPLSSAVYNRLGQTSSYSSRIRAAGSTRSPLIRQRPNIPPPPEPPVRYFGGAPALPTGSGRPGDKRHSDGYRHYSPGRSGSHRSSHREPSPKRHRSSSRHHGSSSLERMDKEDLVRLMRRREEEHKQREKERELEREKARLRAERERLEREKLEIQQLKLTAQLASVQQHFLQQAQPMAPLTGMVPGLAVPSDLGASRAAVAPADDRSRRERERVNEKERVRPGAPPPSARGRPDERHHGPSTQRGSAVVGGSSRYTTVLACQKRPSTRRLSS